MQNQVEVSFFSKGKPNPCLFETKEKKAIGLGLVLLLSLPAPGIDRVRTVPPRLREQEGGSLIWVSFAAQ